MLLNFSRHNRGKKTVGAANIAILTSVAHRESLPGTLVSRISFADVTAWLHNLNMQGDGLGGIRLTDPRRDGYRLTRPGLNWGVRHLIYRRSGLGGCRERWTVAQPGQKGGDKEFP